MRREPMTDKQREVLQFMKKFRRKNGYDATLQTIADHFGCAVNNSYQHVRNLYDKGYVEKTPRGYRAK